MVVGTLNKITTFCCARHACSRSLRAATTAAPLVFLRFLSVKVGKRTPGSRLDFLHPSREMCQFFVLVHHRCLNAIEFRPRRHVPPRDEYDIHHISSVECPVQHGTRINGHTRRASVFGADAPRHHERCHHTRRRDSHASTELRSHAFSEKKMRKHSQFFRSGA